MARLYRGGRRPSSGEAEVPRDAEARIFEVRGEARAGDRFEGLDVPASGLDADVVGEGRDGAVALEAEAGEPAAHVLLVEALRILALGEALGVGALEPEARGVRRVD